MRNILVEITCRDCFYHTHIKSHTMVLAELEPKERERILKTTMFSYQCPRCGSKINFLHNFLYRDKNHEFLIYMSEETKDISELKSQFPHWLLRYVHDAQALAEKIRILEDGLDDRLVELLKLQLFKHMDEVRYFDQDEQHNLWFQCINGDCCEWKGINQQDYLRFQQRYEEVLKQQRGYLFDATWANDLIAKKEG